MSKENIKLLLEYSLLQIILFWNWFVKFLMILTITKFPFCFFEKLHRTFYITVSKIRNKGLPRFMWLIFSKPFSLTCRSWIYSCRKINGQRFWNVVFSAYLEIIWCFCSQPFKVLHQRPILYWLRHIDAWTGTTLHNVHKLGLILLSKRQDNLKSFIPTLFISNKSQELNLLCEQNKIRVVVSK